MNSPIQTSYFNFGAAPANPLPTFQLRPQTSHFTFGGGGPPLNFGGIQKQNEDEEDEDEQSVIEDVDDTEWRFADENTFTPPEWGQHETVWDLIQKLLLNLKLEETNLAEVVQNYLGHNNLNQNRHHKNNDLIWILLLFLRKVFLKFSKILEFRHSFS